MYTYITHYVAPHTVEFHCRTVSGHRVVRVYLDYPTARIVAYNQASSGQTAAVMFEDEIRDLIDRARNICTPTKEQE